MSSFRLVQPAKAPRVVRLSYASVKASAEAPTKNFGVFKLSYSIENVRIWIASAQDSLSLQSVHLLALFDDSSTLYWLS